MTTVHWARCTICHGTSEASLNFTSKCEINVLLVVHSILWRQERQQQQTGNEERVSEGKMIKIKEAETDVRGKNWDQTDNDSETVVENTGVKTTVEVWRSTKRNFLQEGPRKQSKWACSQLRLRCFLQWNWLKLNRSTLGVRVLQTSTKSPQALSLTSQKDRKSHMTFKGCLGLCEGNCKSAGQRRLFFLNSPGQQLIVRH